MFTNMFEALEKGEQPAETFYDGYIVNAIIDASYKSIKSKKWEEINLEIWRGKNNVKKINTLEDFDEKFYLVKEEITHYGDKKLILKRKEDGKIIEKIVKE